MVIPIVQTPKPTFKVKLVALLPTQGSNRKKMCSKNLAFIFCLSLLIVNIESKPAPPGPDEEAETTDGCKMISQ